MQLNSTNTQESFRNFWSVQAKEGGEENLGREVVEMLVLEVCSNYINMGMKNMKSNPTELTQKRFQGLERF